MMPDFLHVVPIADNTVLDGCLNFEDTALLLCLLTNIDLFLVETDHDAWNFGSANHRGEHGPRGIITSKTCLASA